MKSIVIMKKPTFPCTLKQAMKPLEEDGLETQIGYVYAKSLQEEPCRYRHVQRPGFSSEESYRAHANGRHYKD